jgi:hypothetical protein
VARAFYGSEHFGLRGNGLLGLGGRVLSRLSSMTARVFIPRARALRFCRDKLEPEDRDHDSADRLNFYDAELSAHHEHLRAAYGIAPGDAVVDICCGTGLTTREVGAPQRRAAFSASTCPSACLSAPVRWRRPNGSTTPDTS